MAGPEAYMTSPEAMSAAARVAWAWSPQSRSLPPLEPGQPSNGHVCPLQKSLPVGGAPDFQEAGLGFARFTEAAHGAGVPAKKAPAATKTNSRQRGGNLPAATFFLQSPRDEVRAQVAEDRAEARPLMTPFAAAGGGICARAAP